MFVRNCCVSKMIKDSTLPSVMVDKALLVLIKVKQLLGFCKFYVISSKGLVTTDQ